MSSTPKADPIVTEQVVGDDEQLASPGCGILAKYPVLSVLFFAAAGIGTGIGLSYWEPENMDNKDILLKWLGLIGDLFVSFFCFRCAPHPKIVCWCAVFLSCSIVHFVLTIISFCRFAP